MLYYSTRNNQITSSPAEALLRGLAPDGGLFLPESFESAQINLEKTLTMTSNEISAEILSKFFTDFTKAEIDEIVNLAYNGTFESEEFAPLAKVGGKFVLELYHGPTCAFKDVALSVLPRLVTAAKKKLGDESETVVLTATSGDTGSAAAHGFSDVPGTKIIVFYPARGTSAVQEKQMTSCPGKNVFVAAVDGNFDDAQSGVKKIFAECTMPEGKALSSANSINIGRLTPQIAYYFTAYRDLVNAGEITLGEKVDFVVPTGNFGDILAGYFASLIGLPVGKLVCASNENRVLTEFFESGRYNKKREFHITKSPSMDILISSNLERLLSLLLGTQKTAEYMASLAENGEYVLSAEELAKFTDKFAAGACNDEETLATIGEVYKKHGYLMDTHTAVAWNVAEKLGVCKNKTVVLSTASPYKFSASVLKALGAETSENEFEMLSTLKKLTGAPVPASLARLAEAENLHTDKIKKEEMQNYVLARTEEEI
ncbi:MAG: threonine synthase [Clostridia bacterium]|nr:threonine synthase [Clostridia bacterium]